ncbi:hypothetical protein EKD04_009405 [Chloroflexales bacterium ZM16-3]|nr:hypothetical protein [Chloroflexales bacterium ZM16-3]
MAQTTRPAPPRWRALTALLDLLSQFAAHAWKPFAGAGLPNWYIYSTFVLALITTGSLLLNILLLAMIVYATR